MRHRPTVRDVLSHVALAVGACYVPALAAGQTSTSILAVTAQVANSCNFDSTLTDLLSVTCSLETPLATASVATSLSFAGGPTIQAIPDNASGTNKPKIKLCNALASSILENGSFNQFAAAIQHKSQVPAHYFSTFQICF